MILAERLVKIGRCVYSVAFTQRNTGDLICSTPGKPKIRVEHHPDHGIRSQFEAVVKGDRFSEVWMGSSPAQAFERAARQHWNA